MQLLVVFFGALLVSAALTRWVRDFSNARGWNAGPSSDRHIHTRRLPRLGGVAIFLTLWGAVLAAWVAERFGAPEFALLHMAFRILGPATIIFVVGLVDDFRGLGPYVKFVAQVLAAVLLFSSGFGISHLSLLAGHPHLGWLVGLPLTILWVVLITNAFNLIDGLDGLASGAALFSALINCVVAVLFHSEAILLLTLALAGAIAGFLRYNFNPASIFLGDCGSLLIGFLLSAIALAGSQKAPTAVAVAIPIVSLGLPIVDVAVAVFRRFLSCKRLFAADREHIHHKLLSLGISHRQAVLVLYGVSACFGLLSLFLLHPASILAIAVLIVAGIGVIVGIQKLRYHEFVELGRVANRTLHQRHVIANDINIRRAPEALRSCASLPQFCQILQRCLKPAGFDGFGLYLSSASATGQDLYPFGPVSGSEFRFFWNHLLRLPETNWCLSLNLLKRTGEPLGGFTLFRKSGSSPLLMDLEVFSGTEFSHALAAVVEEKKDSWFVRVPKEKTEVPGFGTTGAAIALLVPRAVETPSSG